MKSHTWIEKEKLIIISNINKTILFKNKVTRKSFLITVGMDDERLLSDSRKSDTLKIIFETTYYQSWTSDR